MIKVATVLKDEDNCYNSNDIFIKENALPHHLCDELVNEYRDATIYSPTHYSRYNRVNLPLDHSIITHLSPVLEEGINFFNAKVDFFEPFNVKKYTFGNYYGEHVDAFPSVNKRVNRKLTLVVQLSYGNEYTSGDLYFNEVNMPRTKGTLMLFPSNYSHGVNIVKSGERWVLVSWAWGPVA